MSEKGFIIEIPYFASKTALVSDDPEMSSNVYAVFLGLSWVMLRIEKKDFHVKILGATKILS